MICIEKDQWNKLLKIKILKQGNNQWELRCISDINNNQVRKGEIIFRGSEEEFKLLLRRLKASDTETTPAGTKNITYQQMIDLASNPKGNYIYVKTKNWNEYKNGKKLTVKEDKKIDRVLMETVYHHVLNMEVEKYTLNSTIKRKINKKLTDITSPPYYTEIPLDDINNVLKLHGVIMIQEDLEEWTGFLLGDRSETSIAIGDYTNQIDNFGSSRTPAYKPFSNSVLRLSWYKMSSGKYEIVCYLT
ncbi:MAG: hypothetical protein ACOC3V_00480 [bacterium]